MKVWFILVKKFTTRLILALILTTNSLYAIPDFNLYLYKQNHDDKLINWNDVLNIGNKNSSKIEKINILSLSPYGVEKKIRDYSKGADVIFAVRNNEVIMKTKSINDDFSLVSYDFSENNGCLMYNISIVDKKTFLIRRLSDKFCIGAYISEYPDKTITYNTPVSTYSNNQNGYGYLFIFNTAVDDISTAPK